MENTGTIHAPDKSIACVMKKLSELISSDKYKYEIIACLTVGILFGCITQSLYGSSGEWKGILEKYCSGFMQPLLSVIPVTLGFLAAIFVCAPFQTARLLIYPGAAVRGMGIGALLCGAMQCGSLREMCFTALALLPYAVANCVIAVYAGEYALGLSEAFSGENEGMTKRLVFHTFKMGFFYLFLAALSCLVFAGTCRLFGLYLI